MSNGPPYVCQTLFRWEVDLVYNLGADWETNGRWHKRPRIEKVEAKAGDQIPI